MKRRGFRFLALLVALFTILATLTGCSMLKKMNESAFYEALENAFQYDNMTIKYEIDGSMYGERFKVSMSFIVEDGTKYKMSYTEKLIDSGESDSETLYYYLEDDDWYEVYKDEYDDWVASVDPYFSGIDDVISDFEIDASMFEEDGDYGFDDLVFKRGRYYLSDEMLDEMNSEDMTYDHVYIGFSKKKLSELGMKMTTDDGDTMTIKISISYKGKVNIPRHTID